MASQVIRLPQPSRSTSPEVIPGRASSYPEESSARKVYDTEEDQTLEKIKTYTIYGGISLLLVGGAFLGIQYLIRNAKRKNTVKDALDTGSSASYATRLKMAFENDNYFGWGTDEEVIRSMFESEITSKKMYNDIQKAYSNLYPGRLLNDDLKDELSSSDYKYVMDKLAEKP